MKKIRNLLELVYEIGLLAHGSYDLKSVLQSISARVLEETHASYADIALVDEAQQDTVLSVGFMKNGSLLPSGHRQPLHASIIGKVISTGQSICLKDTSAAEDYVSFVPGMRSELAVPLFFGGRAIGVLNVESELQGQFKAEDIALLQGIANPVALAIENARLYLEEKKMQRRMSMLNQLSRVLTSTVDLDMLLNRVVETIRSQLKYEFVGIGLLHEDKSKAVLKAISSIHPVDLPIGYTQEVGVGVTGEVMATGKRLLVPDVRKRTNYVPAHGDFLCEMCCPVRVGDRLVGYLDAEDRKPSAFDNDDLVLFETIADHISQAVENAENLRRVNELRENLAHMIVHDLRNPLSVIYSSLDMLETAEKRLPEAKKKHYLKTAKGCCDELIILLNSLLELQKIESGKLELQLDMLNPMEIVSRVVESLKVKAETAARTITFDAGDPLPEIKVDGELFLRVLQNLVMNALKSTKRGGHIHISVQQAAGNMFQKYLNLCDIKGNSVSGGVLFSVRDDGCGIPPDELEHIFEKFVTLKTQRVNINGTPQRSTGLGLTFCRLITHAHKGMIWAESEIGKGSIFHVLLPTLPTR